MVTQWSWLRDERRFQYFPGFWTCLLLLPLLVSHRRRARRGGGEKTANAWQLLMSLPPPAVGAFLCCCSPPDLNGPLGHFLFFFWGGGGKGKWSCSFWMGRQNDFFYSPPRISRFLKKIWEIVVRVADFGDENCCQSRPLCAKFSPGFKRLNNHRAATRVRVHFECKC